MEIEDRLYLYRQAAKQWGIVTQYLQCSEEMSELNTAICHLIRDRIKPNNSHLAEEIADVELCIEQLKDILGNYIKVEGWKKLKLGRLKKMLAYRTASNI